ncbi:type II toxin-antitoxin system Phd/YefM family antitoxin [Ruania alkalisoli]|uniref:Antitoxin n=1 Tax=Ruania alkalisoli TaxID=2779775 RepID=A0A7M1SPW9_9MICO|nr:type II toxin-antitoxin system prevent-host-death family antitoxin [Ruania alkalisoli]QOR69491.1 type II toxin-antitoxin system Phd/YefM family antitoxin [Ruania alkalisoli]
MATVSVYEAKSQLSRLIADAERGEETVVTRHGRPVARLVPFSDRRDPRVPGRWRGRVVIADDFDDFSAEDERDWYGA